MNIIKTLTPATLIVALGLAALPAAAQEHDRGNRGRNARETASAAGPRQQSPSRQAAPRQNARDAAPRDNARPQVVPNARPQVVSNARPQVVPNARPQAVPRQYAPRPEYRYEPRHDVGHAYAAPHGYRPYYGSVAPYRPHYFPRPYYAFRPHLHLGFGFWLGFAVPYPSVWVSAYAPPVYGYYQGRVGVIPGAALYGGVSFDIAPGNAAIYLDGAYIGYAGDFAPNAMPLTVTPGPHQIEVMAEGYRSMTWNVNILAGQVIPFRGAMQPY